MVVWGHKVISFSPPGNSAVTDTLFGTHSDQAIFGEKVTNVLQSVYYISRSLLHTHEGSLYLNVIITLL